MHHPAFLDSSYMGRNSLVNPVKQRTDETGWGCMRTVATWTSVWTVWLGREQVKWTKKKERKKADHSSLVFQIIVDGNRQTGLFMNKHITRISNRRWATTQQGLRCSVNLDIWSFDWILLSPPSKHLEKKNTTKHCRHRRLLYLIKCFRIPSVCLWILLNYQVLPRKSLKKLICLFW